MEQEFGLADLLAGLTDFGKNLPEVAKDTLACPSCGLLYDDFRKFGRFGCAQCYAAFKPHLKTLLKKIHGSNIHLGKKIAVPDLPEVAVVEIFVKPSEPAVPVVETIDVLRLRLSQAIKKEDFELAAQLRDQIRELELEG
jgi:protein arginine kinase activator